MIVLDTDCVSLLERDNEDAAVLRKRLTTAAPGEVVTTIITFEEQMRGWLAFLAKARTLEKQIVAYSKLFRFLENYRVITVLPFESVAAIEFERLQKQKIRVGTMDLKIASIALANNALLVTRNIADFEQVPNLQIADWTKP
jgi:tRNA(fMet)-specific endonuclease VapC